MAVQDKYVNSNVQDNELAVAAFSQGDKTITLIAKAEVAAADDNGSVYRLGRLNGALVPVSIRVFNDEITGGTDWDLGLYEAGAGKPVKVKDIFADGLDFDAQANPRSGGGLEACNLSNADSQKKIHELAGDTLDNSKNDYDLALTANTVGTASGEVLVIATFTQG